MTLHPTVRVPDLGAMDHAWDLLGRWELRVTSAEVPRTGVLDFPTWEDALLGWPSPVLGGLRPVAIRRTAPVTRSSAGGGALALVFEGMACGQVVLTLWPGELQLRIEGPLDGETAITATARRPREYYDRKYPRPPG